MAYKVITVVWARREIAPPGEVAVFALLVALRVTVSMQAKKNINH